MTDTGPNMGYRPPARIPDWHRPGERGPSVRWDGCHGPRHRRYQEADQTCSGSRDRAGDRQVTTTGGRRRSRAQPLLAVSPRGAEGTQALSLRAFDRLETPSKLCSTPHSLRRRRPERRQSGRRARPPDAGMRGRPWRLAVTRTGCGQNRVGDRVARGTVVTWPRPRGSSCSLYLQKLLPQEPEGGRRGLVGAGNPGPCPRCPGRGLARTVSGGVHLEPSIRGSTLLTALASPRSLRRHLHRPPRTPSRGADCASWGQGCPSPQDGLPGPVPV